MKKLLYAAALAAACAIPALLVLLDVSVFKFCCNAAGFFLVLCIRENDKWLDLVWHGFWLYPALLVTALACALAARSPKTILPGIWRIIQDDLSSILATGFFITVGFSRMFGMKPIWREAVGMDEYRVAKHVAEEGTELLGYALMLAWAILFVCNLVRENRAKRCDSSAESPRHFKGMDKA